MAQVNDVDLDIVKAIHEALQIDDQTIQSYTVESETHLPSAI